MNRGEVWDIEIPSEDGTTLDKIPAVIVNNDIFHTFTDRVIIPFIPWKTSYTSASWLVRVNQRSANGLPYNAAADAFQLMAITSTKFIGKIGELSQQEITDVEDAISLVLGI